eukprot:TRINITY_DN12396_c0_g1_i27.p1 TRINITY_DN12396_c0_g1~~TRINITY_DN12396_c0_g1_i27.p1  ORF type:complete len:1114 (+),score=128.18 TRINITY_DN12396_c0_g1_i27:76-3417(+)
MAAEGQLISTAWERLKFSTELHFGHSLTIPAWVFYVLIERHKAKLLKTLKLSADDPVEVIWRADKIRKAIKALLAPSESECPDSISLREFVEDRLASAKNFTKIVNRQKVTVEVSHIQLREIWMALSSFPEIDLDKFDGQKHFEQLPSSYVIDLMFERQNVMVYLSNIASIGAEPCTPSIVLSGGNPKDMITLLPATTLFSDYDDIMAALFECDIEIKNEGATCTMVVKSNELGKLGIDSEEFACETPLCAFYAINIKTPLITRAKAWTRWPPYLVFTYYTTRTLLGLSSANAAENQPLLPYVLDPMEWCRAETFTEESAAEEDEPFEPHKRLINMLPHACLETSPIIIVPSPGIGIVVIAVRAQPQVHVHIHTIGILEQDATAVRTKDLESRIDCIIAKVLRTKLSLVPETFDLQIFHRAASSTSEVLTAVEVVLGEHALYTGRTVTEPFTTLADAKDCFKRWIETAQAMKAKAEQSVDDSLNGPLPSPSLVQVEGQAGDAEPSTMDANTMDITEDLEDPTEAVGADEDKQELTPSAPFSQAHSPSASDAEAVIAAADQQLMFAPHDDNPNTTTQSASHTRSLRARNKTVYSSSQPPRKRRKGAASRTPIDKPSPSIAAPSGTPARPDRTSPPAEVAASTSPLSQTTVASESSMHYEPVQSEITVKVQLRSSLSAVVKHESSVKVHDQACMFALEDPAFQCMRSTFGGAAAYRGRLPTFEMMTALLKSKAEARKALYKQQRCRDLVDGGIESALLSIAHLAAEAQRASEDHQNALWTIFQAARHGIKTLEGTEPQSISIEKIERLTRATMEDWQGQPHYQHAHSDADVQDETAYILFVHNARGRATLLGPPRQRFRNERDQLVHDLSQASRFAPGRIQQWENPQRLFLERGTVVVIRGGVIHSGVLSSPPECLPTASNCYNFHEADVEGPDLAKDILVVYVTTSSLSDPQRYRHGLSNQMLEELVVHEDLEDGQLVGHLNLYRQPQPESLEDPQFYVAGIIDQAIGRINELPPSALCHVELFCKSLRQVQPDNLSLFKTYDNLWLNVAGKLMVRSYCILQHLSKEFSLLQTSQEIHEMISAPTRMTMIVDLSPLSYLWPRLPILRAKQLLNL